MARSDHRPSPVLLQDGRILVAQRANDEERWRMVRVAPEDEPYAAWLAQVQERGRRDAVRVVNAGLWRWTLQLLLVYVLLAVIAAVVFAVAFDGEV